MCAGQRAAAAAPHVVIFRVNEVHLDTRAKKIALSLARAGYRVTLVAPSDAAAPARGTLGPVHVITRPVPFRVRDAIGRRRHRRRSWRPPIAPSPQEVAARRLRAAVRRRDLVLAEYDAVGHVPPALRAVTSSWYRGRRAVVKAWTSALDSRVALSKALSGQITRAWRLFDARIRNVRRRASWQQLLPEVWDYELAFGTLLEQLEPDVLHLHHPRVLGIGRRAAARMARRGRSVRIVYDARENFAGLPEAEWGSPRYHEAIVRLEAEHIRAVDKVLTVSDPIADALHQRYDLRDRPTVVFNMPVDRPWDATGMKTVRDATGLGPKALLMVYGGTMSHGRGMDVLVRALPLLPDVHLALVTVPYPHPMTPDLVCLAAELGVSERITILPPVSQEELVPFLSTATIGVHPMPGGSPNHDMALPNKLFEYVHAGLPIVVSDAATIARFVRDNHLGASFRSGDASDLARAVRNVLNDLPSFMTMDCRADLIRRCSWQGQEEVLRALYASVAPVAGQTKPPWEFPSLDVQLTVETEDPLRVV